MRSVIVIVGSLAACWTQSSAVETIATEPSSPHAASSTSTPPAPAPARGNVASPNVVASSSQTCTSVAPFVVTATDATGSASDLCGAFERAWLAMPPTTIASGTFEIEVVLREVRARSRRVECQLEMSLRGQGKRIAKIYGLENQSPTTDDCANVVVADLLLIATKQMQKHMAAMSAPQPQPQPPPQPNPASPAPTTP